MNEQRLKQRYEMFSWGHFEMRRRLMAKLLLEPQPAKRRTWMPAISGLAAMFCIAAIAWWLTSLQSPVRSWAQVAAQLESIRSASYDYTISVRHADGNVTSVNRRVALRVGQQLRNTFISSSQPTNSDHKPLSHRSSWILNPNGHPGTSIYFSEDQPQVGLTQNLFVGTPVRQVEDEDTWLTRLRAMDDKRIVRKGEQLMDGKKVIRFEQPMNEVGAIIAGGMTVWVDASTGLPVRTSEQETNTAIGKAEVKTVTLDHLSFNPPIADSQFDWPDVKHKQVEQQIVVYISPGTKQPTLSVRITTGSGEELAGPADFGKPITSADHGRNVLLWSLEPIGMAQKRIAAYTKGHIGQELFVHVSASERQPVEIFGTFISMSVKSDIIGEAPAARSSTIP